MSAEQTRRYFRTCVQIVIMIWLGMHAKPVAALDIEAQRKLVNQGVLGILCDGARGSQIELMGDLATVLDDGYDMRIVPIVGKGSVRAIEDLLLLRGVDIALVQADVLDYYRRADLFPDIGKKLQYIAKLYNEEVHILASKDINSIEELRGKKVNFGPPASGSYITASLVFEQLDIDVQPRDDDYQVALEKLRQGKIDAWVRVAAKPMMQMKNLPEREGLHLLSVSPSLVGGAYAGAELTSEDYPHLIAADRGVETVAIASVMTVYNWPPRSRKRQHLDDFAHRFVAGFDRLQQSAFHPKWREVDLTVDLPGWERFQSVSR